jgi:hypothetical protein
MLAPAQAVSSRSIITKRRALLLTLSPTARGVPVAKRDRRSHGKGGCPSVTLCSETGPRNGTIGSVKLTDAGMIHIRPLVFGDRKRNRTMDAIRLHDKRRSRVKLIGKRPLN